MSQQVANVPYKIYLTEDEHIRVIAVADQEGVTPNVWIRTVLDCCDLADGVESSCGGGDALLGEQVGKDGLGGLSLLESLVRLQDQCLNQGLNLLSSGLPDGFDGGAAFLQ